MRSAASAVQVVAFMNCPLSEFVRRRTVVAGGRCRIDTARDERGHVRQPGNVALVIVRDVLDDAAPRAGLAVTRRFAPQLYEELLPHTSILARRAAHPEPA